MEAHKLYQHLQEDFITQGMWDDWAEGMNPLADYLCENFKTRSMGLVCDFTPQINRVYTAVFPSPAVMSHVLDSGMQDGLLFLHHPMVWDIRKAPEVFQQMESLQVQRFQGAGLSIYALHVPLDHFGKHSTTVTFSRALGIDPEEPFFRYYGALVGVFGRTACGTVHELHKTFQDTVQHQVSLYSYGDEHIQDGRVAVIAGGGNTVDALEEIAESGVNTFLTGITAKNDYSIPAHKYAEEHRINLLGGTHYSTEKFACLSMVNYFQKLGLPAEFIEDTPLLEDL